MASVQEKITFLLYLHQYDDASLLTMIPFDIMYCIIKEIIDDDAQQTIASLKREAQQCKPPYNCDY